MSRVKSKWVGLVLVSLCGAALVAAAASAQMPVKHAQAAPAATPQTGPQNSTSTSTFDDWVVRCAATPPAAKVCEVAQTIATRAANQQQQSVVAEIVLGRVAKADPLKLIVQLPPGVWLPAGASLTVGNAPTIAMPFTQCLQACIAQVELKPEIVQALRSPAKPDPGHLEFEDGAQRKVSLNVSPKGLAAALAARDEQTGQ